MLGTRPTRRSSSRSRGPAALDGGAWEWHQDFGYWYSQGLTQPDKIVSGIVAIDANDREAPGQTKGTERGEEEGGASSTSV